MSAALFAMKGQAAPALPPPGERSGAAPAVRRVLRMAPLPDGGPARAPARPSRRRQAAAPVLRKFTLRLDEARHAALAALAERRGCSRNRLLAALLDGCTGTGEGAS